MIKYRLFEDAESDDIHIYVDEATGDYYYFDGTKLVKLGGKPRVGDKGNKDIQDEEERKRQAQIEKEKQEKNDSDDDDDYSDETEEEREARISELENELSSDDIKKAIEDEIKEKKAESEKQKIEKQKAADYDQVKKSMPNQGLEGFKLSLNKFIKRELEHEPEYSYSKINKKYARSGIIKPGIKRRGDSIVPSINVYFDQSGSWSLNDINIGMSAIKSLDKYVQKKLVKVNIFFFANDIQSTPQGGVGGTETWKVVEHIKEHKPDNVIIMTDEDGDAHYNVVEYNSPAIVKGSVWWLWRKGYISKEFRSHVIGKRENKEFKI